MKMDVVGTPKALDDAPPSTAKLSDVLPLRSIRKRRRRAAEARVPASDAPSENPRRRLRRRGASGPAESPGAQAPISSSAEPAFREGETGGEQFRVGDLVWGKLKNGEDSWWPGKVLDPSSRRTGKAKKHGEDGYFPVFFFGKDGAVAWHEPSQLRPFRREFKRMAERNSSEGLAAAVTDALAEVKDAVDSEMACFPNGGQEDRDAVATYALRPREFLELAHDAARNISCIDKLDATLLRCRALTFRPWNAHLAEEAEHAGWNDKLEQCQAAETGGGAMRPLQMSEGEVRQRRKKRNIAEVIGSNESVLKDQYVNSIKCLEETTIAMAAAVHSSPQPQKRSKRRSRGNKVSSVVGNDVSVVSEVKYGNLEELNPSSSTPKRNKSDGTKSNKCSDTKNGGSRDAEETTGYSRRERKLSRFLSPPYTNVGGYTKRSFPFKDEASEMQNESETSQLPLTESLPSRKGNSVVSRKKDISTTPLFNLDKVSAHAILSKFQSAASNPLHPKGNLSSKAVRYFFEKFRDSAYAHGSDSQNYKKLLDKSSNEHCISKVIDLGVHSGKEKTTAKKSKGKSVIDTLMDHDHNNSEPIEYLRKRKVSSNKSETQSLANGHHKSPNGSTEVEGDRKEMGISDSADKTKLQQVAKLKMADALNAQILDDLPVSMINKSRKKRKTVNAADAAIALDLELKTSCSSHGPNSRKQGKRKVGTISENPVSLVLRFTAGTELPSKGELISTHSIFGEVDETHTEVLQDTLCARVVFKRRTDADKAVHSLYSDKAFISSVFSYELHCYTEKISTTVLASETPLPSVKKSLEKMISELTGFTPPRKDGRSSNHLRSEVRDDLVGEMNSLLKKVNKILTGPSAGTSNFS